MKLTYVLIAILSFTVLPAKDPFLSPFEEKIETSVKTKDKVYEPTAKEILRNEFEKDIAQIEMALQAENVEKAKELLKTMVAKSTSDEDKEKIKSLQNEADNYKEIQAKILECKSLINIQGKVILSGKKNLLLINGQPVTEGDLLTDTIKIDNPIFLHEIKEEYYRLRLNNVCIKLTY